MLVMHSVFARAGLLTTLGISSGLFLHATLSALGLSLILVRSVASFEVVKLVGACYLIYLEGQSIWQAFHSGERAPHRVRGKADDRASLFGLLRQLTLSRQQTDESRLR